MALLAWRAVRWALQRVNDLGRRVTLFFLSTSLQFQVAQWVFRMESCNSVLMPRLERACRLSAAGVAPPQPVAASQIGAYTIIAAPSLLGPLLALAQAYHAKDVSRQRELECSALEALVQQVLPHVRVHSGQTPAAASCILYSCIMERGAYIPVAHWDTNWSMFPGAEAVQLWYLLENEDDKNEGNMFMVQTPMLRPEDHGPIRIAVKRDGSVHKLTHTVTGWEEVLERFASVEAAGCEYAYIDARPGECLLFSKRTLHMSDPRPYLRGRASRRLALNLRLIFRQPDEDGRFTLPFNPSHVLCEMNPMHAELQRRAQPDGRGGHTVRVGKHEMVEQSGLFLETDGR